MGTRILISNLPGDATAPRDPRDTDPRAGLPPASVAPISSMNWLLDVPPVSVPPHDNSAMDGYAFASSDLDTAPGDGLSLIGTAAAGTEEEHHDTKIACCPPRSVHE